MARSGRSPLERVKLSIIAITLLLTAAGILFVHSTTTAVGDPFPSRSAALQIVKAAVALAGLILITRIDYRRLDQYAYVIYGTVCVVLAGMLAVKVASGGRNRFIDIYLFQVQPSELMKLGLIAALASYLRFRESQRRVLGLVGPFGLTLLPMVLVLLQPNLGLSLMFPPVLLAMLFVAGAKARFLAIAVLAGVLSLAAAYTLGDKLPFLKPYQRDRFKAFFIRDESTARNEGLQLRQSLIAIGSGGAFGKGYGEGTQNTLSYLPEKETDFIFSIVAEETGFAGALALVVLLFSLAALILKVAIHTREPFGRLVATGIATLFAAQSFENIGMTLGLMPITGIALPFVSLAGSNLVASCLAIGIVLNIASRQVAVVATKDLDPEDSGGIQLVVEDRAAALLQARWPVE